MATAIREGFAGNGYTGRAIKLGLKKGKSLGFKRMIGSIREDKVASMKAYRACGVEVLNNYKEVYIPKLDVRLDVYF